jgi:hypothetical protein
MFTWLRNSTLKSEKESRSPAARRTDFIVSPVCEALEGRRLYSATLSGSIAGSLPQSLLPDTVDHVTLRLTNTGDAVVAGRTTVSLYASTDQTVNAGAELLGMITRPVLLRPQKSTALGVRFSPPANLTVGDYFLVAKVDALAKSNGSLSETVIASRKAVSVPQPFVDLTGKITSQPTCPLIVVASGTPTGSASVLVMNKGNVPARGPLDITLYASTDNMLDSAATQIAAAHFNNVNIRAGGSRTFPVRLTLPGNMPVGSYTLFASINSANTIAESNLANNIVAARKPLVLINPPTGIDHRDHHHQEQNNSDGSDFVEVDVTTIDDSSDSYDTGDVPDTSSPPPDVAPPATAPTDSGDAGNSIDSSGSDFGGDFSGDTGGGADF